MTKNRIKCLIIGGWGTAVKSSIGTVTGMNIDTYGDQNNIKYPNKIKFIKLSLEWMKRDKFL